MATAMLSKLAKTNEHPTQSEVYPCSHMPLLASLRELSCAGFIQSPLLINSKKDHQRVLQSQEQLLLKVEDSMRRCQRAETEREDAVKKQEALSRQLETANA